MDTRTAVAAPPAATLRPGQPRSERAGAASEVDEPAEAGVFGSALTAGIGDCGLAPAVRARIEASLGEDLGRVEVTRGVPAADAAQGVRAIAERERISVDPAVLDRQASPEGLVILGEELAHVVQKRHGTVVPDAVDARGPASVAPSGERDRLESEAVRAGRLIAAGQRASIQSGARPPERQFSLWDWASRAYHGAGRLISSGAHAAETAVVDGVHRAETAVDHGAHALAGSVANMPVLGTVARGAADVASAATHAVGNVAEGAAHAVAHPIASAERASQAVTHGVQSAERGVTHAMHRAEAWVDREGHALAGRVAHVPVLGTVARGAADAASAYAQFEGGVIEGATGLVGGVVNMAAHPINTAAGIEQMAEHGRIPMVSTALRAGHDAINGRGLGDIARRATNPLSTAAEDGQFWTHMGSQVIAPWREAWDGGHRGEAVGRAAFDIGSMLIGGGEARAATRATELAGLAGRTERAAGLARTAGALDRAAPLARTGGAVERTAATSARTSGEVASATTHAAPAVEGTETAASSAAREVRSGGGASTAERPRAQGGEPPRAGERSAGENRDGGGGDRGGGDRGGGDRGGGEGGEGGGGDGGDGRGRGRREPSALEREVEAAEGYVRSVGSVEAEASQASERARQAARRYNEALEADTARPSNRSHEELSVARRAVEEAHANLERVRTNARRLHEGDGRVARAGRTPGGSDASLTRAEEHTGMMEAERTGIGGGVRDAHPAQIDAGLRVRGLQREVEAAEQRLERVLRDLEEASRRAETAAARARTTPENPRGQIIWSARLEAEREAAEAAQRRVRVEPEPDPPAQPQQQVRVQVEPEEIEHTPDPSRPPPRRAGR
jgi:hypothetical protein